MPALVEMRRVLGGIAVAMKLFVLAGGMAIGQTAVLPRPLSADAAFGERFSPVANALPTNGALVVQRDATQDDTREYVATFGLRSGKGQQFRGRYQGDKVALYAGAEGKAGTGDLWSLNTVLTLDRGSGDYNAQGYELDLNNNAGDRGDDDGGAGLRSPISYGMTITGAGGFRSTAAFGIVGPGRPIWNRGIVVGSNSVRSASFQDLGNSDISLDIRGRHRYGLDLSQGFYAAAALRLPAGGVITSGGNGKPDVPLLLVVPGGGLALAAPLVPVAGTSATLGTAEKPFAEAHVLDVRTVPARRAIPLGIGELAVEATSDQVITLRLRGRDGIVRSARIALSP